MIPSEDAKIRFASPWKDVSRGNAAADVTP